MVDIRKLLKYNEAVRHSYLDCLAKLSWDEFTKNREASFHSMRNIFVHTLRAIDFWLDFLQGEKLMSNREFNDYTTFQEVKAYTEQVEKRMENYLNSAPSGSFTKTYIAAGDNGKKVTVTVEDVLIHLFEEEVHHRGELIALLWQMNVEPPVMSWKGL